MLQQICEYGDTILSIYGDDQVSRVSQTQVYSFLRDITCGRTQKAHF